MLLGDLRYRLRAIFRWRRIEEELDEELRFHVERQIERYVRSGISQEEARRRTRLTFGGFDSVKEECRQARGVDALETSFQDLRYALRMWRKSPCFALAAIAAIALGIGANAAVFTVVNALLIKNLPFEGSDRIFYISGDKRTEAGYQPVSYPDFRDYRAETKSFAGLAAFFYADAGVSDKSGFPQRYRAIRMSYNGLSILGQRPVEGRDFTPADARPGAIPVAILTYRLWQDRYGKDRSIAGKTIRVDGVPTVIAGVTPPGVMLAGGNDLWLPLIPTADFERRGNRNLLVLGRLAEHANLHSANAEIQTIARGLEREYPATNKGIGALVQNMADAHLNRRAQTLLRALLGAVGFLLLIACANVANLLLGRAVARSREISIRAALGAGRRRLIRQLLIESLLLSSAGGLVGCLLAIWGVHAFVTAMSRIETMPALDFSMDHTVFLYLIAISAGTGPLFGLAPALRLSRLDIHAALKDGCGMAGDSYGRSLAGVLVTAETALAVALSTGAGVMIHNVVKIAHTPTGVDVSNVLTMSIELPAAKYPLPRGPIEFQRRLKTRLESLPGVDSVSFSSALPGTGWMIFAPSIAYEIEGAPPVDARQRPKVDSLVIAPDYFRLLAVGPLVGREFSGADNGAANPVMIVNRSCAARFWPGENPVGKRLRAIGRGLPQTWWTVAGVVPDILYNDFKPHSPLLYAPYRQFPLRSMYVLARTRVPPLTLAKSFRRETQAIDRDLPVSAPMPLDRFIALHHLDVRLFSAVFAVFAFIGLLLASTGLYAVIAHSVNRRTQEIGVRVAMGASPKNVLRLILLQGLRSVGAGWALGLLLSFAVTRVIRGLLVGISPADPTSFAAVTLILITAALLGCIVPARRAIRIDPTVTLRRE